MVNYAFYLHILTFVTVVLCLNDNIAFQESINDQDKLKYIAFKYVNLLYFMIASKYCDQGGAERNKQIISNEKLEQAVFCQEYETVIDN